MVAMTDEQCELTACAPLSLLGSIKPCRRAPSDSGAAVRVCPALASLHVIDAGSLQLVIIAYTPANAKRGARETSVSRAHVARRYIVCRSVSDAIYAHQRLHALGLRRRVSFAS